MSKSRGELLVLAAEVEENSHLIDALVRPLCLKVFEDGDCEEYLALLRPQLRKVINQGVRLLDMVEWAIRFAPALKAAVENAEEGCESNLATDEQLAWWLSAVVWATVVSNEKNIPASGINVWIDTTHDDDSSEATWISFQQGVVTIRRDWWGDTVWKAQRDAAVSYPFSMSASGVMNFMKSKLEYISWQQENFERNRE